MKNSGKLTVTTPSDRVILMTRAFQAPRQPVFNALTKPELLKRWPTGPPGWTFAESETDLKVGGAYRFAWSKAGGMQMGVSGVYRELTPPERFAITEKFDESWYPGETVVTNALEEDRLKTTLTLTVKYKPRGARDVAPQSPMEAGVAMGYDRLENIVEKLGISRISRCQMRKWIPGR
jgi:uncharacterized protein YndB with AHSA1/START domain